MDQKGTARPLLEGVRVLDFGRYIAGPYCAALLGDLGAEVIRVEKREGSEDRFVQPVVPGAAAGEGGEGAMYLQMNRNKLGLTLDPMSEKGREVVKKLPPRRMSWSPTCRLRRSRPWGSTMTA